MREAKNRALSNVDIVTADINHFNDFGPGKKQFDRIISIEVHAARATTCSVPSP